jgi:hypothetical protein
MIPGSAFDPAMTTNWAVSTIKYQNLQAIIFYAALPETAWRESFDNSKEAL